MNKEIITVNFVMSSEMQSLIFVSINDYFKKYLGAKFKLIISKSPINGADIYHYHRPNLEKKIRKNSVITVHHDLKDTDPSFSLSNYIDQYCSSDRVICLNSSQEEILNKKGVLNTSVIPHGYNNDIFSLKDQLKFSLNKKVCLGIVSKRYSRRVKGEAYLLELLKRLNPERFSFLLVGENRREDYKTITEYGFDVTLYEKIPYILFNQVYHKIDFLLILSLFEGGPANVPEALATGTPIIGRQVGMIPDLIENNKNGMYITDDIEVDSTTFLDISENKNDLYNSLQKNSQNIGTLFTWAEVVSQYSTIYLDMVDNSYES